MSFRDSIEDRRDAWIVEEVFKEAPSFRRLVQSSRRREERPLSVN